jgi:hypothetical protein
LRRPRVSGAGKVVGAAAARANDMARGVRRATTGAGSTAAGGVAKGVAGAADTGRAAAGGAASTAAGVTTGATGTVKGITGTAKGVVGSVGSTLGVSFSFLVAKAAILLELIKRLALMAVNALKDLARRLRELAASRSDRPEAHVDGEGGKRTRRA